MKTNDEPVQLKLIAVGDSGVGKSSILLRFTNDRFDEFSEPTLGAAFIPKRYVLPDGRNI
jgi:Ras-related protein Rab-5C